MRRIIKRYPVVSTLEVSCLILGILTTFYGQVMYDLFAFHSKPIHSWHYFSGTFMHGSKEAPLWFLWLHLVLNTLMLLPFGGLVERKRGSKYVFVVFITTVVISSTVFHILTRNQDIQASGISAVGYAFVTGGLISMLDVWKTLTLGWKLFYFLLIVISLIMLLPHITGWISTILHLSGIASYVIVFIISNYYEKKHKVSWFHKG